jgi:hypothetical protein
MQRREFIRNISLAAGAALAPATAKAAKPIRVTRVGSNFEREPLIRPFGFKGG